VTALELCEGCGFDSRRWDERDTVNTIRSLGVRWAGTIEGMDPGLLQVRPDPDTWSIAEYTRHAREALWSMRFVLDVAADDPGSDLGDLPTDDGPGPHRTVDVDVELARLDEEASALFQRAVRLDPAQWELFALVDGEPMAIGWVLRHAVHDVSHHLQDVGRIRVRLGAGAPPVVGRLDRINRSDGGVPKRPVPRAEVTWRGVDGDRQAARQHHGRPWQALCLWSSEVIDALRAEGHPIDAGAAGENLTVSGIEWPTIRPGTRLRVGDVLCEVSAYAEPCSKNGRWFSDGDSGRIEHGRHPGWSRVYASVLEPGAVGAGDAVVVEPPP
jgi:MOSC domain-containing protein YiiM